MDLMLTFASLDHQSIAFIMSLCVCIVILEDMAVISDRAKKGCSVGNLSSALGIRRDEESNVWQSVLLGFQVFA